MRASRGLSFYRDFTAAVAGAALVALGCLLFAYFLVRHDSDPVEQARQQAPDLLHDSSQYVRDVYQRDGQFDERQLAEEINDRVVRSEELLVHVDVSDVNPQVVYLAVESMALANIGTVLQRETIRPEDG